ncbi:helix-turn-helix transcriptional regulator [Streptosporangium sp. NPDC002524]|uniref:helix-turn-helix domain-containing protein n=1 Tax=Streptosporangium sp. NPDC002524 TaxID=3154537 RepID=UPI0033224DDE
MTTRRPLRSCAVCGTRLAGDNPEVHCGPCQRRRLGPFVGPPSVPSDFWADARLQEGIKARHIGQIIRAYRLHPWHERSLSQERVAAWLHLSQTQLSRIESGRPVQDLTRLTARARLLGLPPALLWFTLPDGQPAAASAGDSFSSHASYAPAGYANPGSPSSAVCETVETRAVQMAREEADNVRRSEFLMLSGATLAGILAPPLIHGWPDRRVAPLPELTDDLLDQLRAQTEGFRWLDRRQGSLRLLPATTRHARGLANFWRLTDRPSRLRAELAEIAADTCHLVAYQAFDQGERTQAIEWYRCSAELAAQAGAQDLYVFAMCGVAYMHARDGHDALAVSVLRQLGSLPLSVAAQCYVAVYEAHAQAAAHDRDRALGALEHAHVLAGRTGHETPSAWLGVTDGSFVDRQAAIVLAEFGDPEALRVLTRLEVRTSAAFRRYQVTLDANFALAHAKLGEVEQATARMTSALARNEHTRSAEKHTRIVDARRVLGSCADAKEVREVDELLRATESSALTSGRSPRVTG